MRSPILIVGFGNPLAGDDGAGLAVIERLHRMGLPQSVRAVNGHTDSLALLELWKGETEIWLVDAVMNGAPPGAIHLLDHHEILSVPQRHASAHHLSLAESLRWVELTYPEMKDVHYRLWGIEPAVVRHVEGLTPAVARAVEQVVIRIRRAVANRHRVPIAS